MTEVGLQFATGSGGEPISPKACVLRYEDTGHETIIRELTQNALDAARAAERSCELKFEIRKINSSQIPGMTDLRKQLRDEYHQEWLDSGRQNYIGVIRQLQRLSNEAETECLLVFDNGIGLSEERMKGLVGKGITGKPEDDGASGGTHGVGHDTTFAAGNLNYVIYAGINQVKNEIAAFGRVLLPTHFCEETKVRWPGHGYLTENIHQYSMFGVDIINRIDRIPSFLHEQLRKIEHSGSVIVIPAFNRFAGASGNVDIGTLICEDVAKHFFVAVSKGQLKVRVDEFGKGGRNTHKLSGPDDVEQFLIRVRNEGYASGLRLVAGSRVYEAWQTYNEGEQHLLHTSFGPIRVRIRYLDKGPSRIVVIRTGMFITDREDKRPSALAMKHFKSRKPFSALLLFAEDIHHISQKRDSADNIIRLAEDAGHTRIRSNLSLDGGRNLKQLCEEIKERLLDVLDEIEVTRSFTPDFLPIQLDSKRRFSVPPLNPIPIPDSPVPHEPSSPQPGPKPPPGPGPGPRPGPNPPRPPSPKGGRQPVDLRTCHVPGGPGQIEVEVVAPLETIANATIQLRTLTGSDQTCSTPLQGQPIELDLARCHRNGVALGKGFEKEIRIRRIEAGSRLRLSLQLANSHDMDLPMRVAVFSE